MTVRIRILLVGLALVGLGLLAACGSPPIALTGTVTDAYTGKPVADAKVLLGERQLTTDASGQFTTDSWSRKDTLQVGATGYEPVQIVLEAQPQLAQPAPPSVSIATTIRPNTFSGLVTDSYTNKPLPGANVQAGDKQATTGADGRYTLADVPEQFDLTISAPDYEAQTQAVSRKTSLDAPLRPNVLSGIVTDRYTGLPLAGATVRAGQSSATSGADGRYRLSGVAEQATLEIAAPGYATLTQPVTRTTSADLVLRPDTLKAQLVDQASGKPVQFATIIATAQPNTQAIVTTRIDGNADGSFTLEGIPEQGWVQVLAPGYRKAMVELKPGAVPPTIKLEPFQSKSLYITAAMASDIKRVRTYFDIIDNTELNSMVLDLKSDLWGDLGLLYYDSQVPLVKELKTSAPAMDLAAILAEAKQRNIYMIARVHIFSHDNVLAEARPEWAGKDTVRGGTLASWPTDEIHYDWLDPWNRNVWDYNIQIATEAAQMGFDEINFDYIRYPDLDPKTYQFSQPTDPVNNPDAMFDNIAEFAKQSQAAINGAGAFFSADVFGYAALRPMWEIGQNIEKMSPYVDYLMPMVYPSHYWFGELGYDDPAKYPYEIVSYSLKQGWQFVQGKRAQLRPWLQNFTLIWRKPIVEYGPAEVRAQIKATEEFPQQAGWALWDPDNDYIVDALKPQE